MTLKKWIKTLFMIMIMPSLRKLCIFLFLNRTITLAMSFLRFFLAYHLHWPFIIQDAWVNWILLFFSALCYCNYLRLNCTFVRLWINAHIARLSSIISTLLLSWLAVKIALIRNWWTQSWSLPRNEIFLCLYGLCLFRITSYFCSRWI